MNYLVNDGKYLVNDGKYLTYSKTFLEAFKGTECLRFNSPNIIVMVKDV